MTVLPMRGKPGAGVSLVSERTSSPTHVDLTPPWLARGGWPESRQWGPNQAERTVWLESRPPPQFAAAYGLSAASPLLDALLQSAFNAHPLRWLNTRLPGINTESPVWSAQRSD